MMKRILVITDSLGLPNNQTSYEETYSYLLRLKGYEVIQLSIGGATSNVLFDQSNYYVDVHPDIVIIQSGIVDCAPRALSRIEERILNFNSITKRLSQLILNRFIVTLRQYRHISYTKIGVYQSYMKRFQERFKKAKVLFVGIIPASDKYEFIVPGIQCQIEKYNSILKSIEGSEFVDTSQIPFSGICHDFHHVNSIGNAYIANIILRTIAVDKNE